MSSIEPTPEEVTAEAAEAAELTEPTEAVGAAEASEPETAGPEEPTAPEEPAQAAEPVAPKPAPSAIPMPRPRPAMPSAPKAPVAPIAPAVAAEPTDAAAGESDEPWGRVDEGGIVSVREGQTWREVGQFPDGDPQEALAYFQRKFQDLAAKVRLLEQRKATGGTSASELATAAKHLRDEITGAAAVGNLASLEARLSALTGSLSEATAAEAAAAREAVDAAITERTALVEKAEALAARDPKSTQWKQASADLTALFDAWQSQQQNGPRLPKALSQQLWKRFRDARAIVEKHRREFYAELDDTHKAARERKTRLAEKAEALVPKGEDGIGSYRTLLDEWKTVGRAGKKVDDALWARFKAAGDALYGARIERDAAEQAESAPRIEAKRELIAEAKAVADESDITKARSILTAIQRRWDEVGRISPRDKERALDDELRKLEQALRGREEVDWKRNNPETKARAGDMSRQLTEAIEKLEAELASAEKAGDKSATAKAQDALDARKAWLKALGG